MPQCSRLPQALLSDDGRQCNQVSNRQKQFFLNKTTAALAVLAASVPAAMAQQNCVSLQGSSACPAFSSASISTNLTGQLYVHLCRTTKETIANQMAYPARSSPSYLM